MMATARRTVRYRGRVQGVGFRYTTLQIARKHPVTGYVRNLANGEVLVVVEGTEAALDQFLAAVGRRMRDNVTETRVETGDATDEFDAFNIR